MAGDGITLSRRADKGRCPLQSRPACNSVTVWGNEQGVVAQDPNIFEKNFATIRGCKPLLGDEQLKEPYNSQS